VRTGQKALVIGGGNTASDAARSAIRLGGGGTTVIRHYGADGSFHILSDRGEIELVDNAGDPYAASPISVVRVP
jgi:NADPH-dependent glutamate synthase beta subunit-like oxidoreductase